MSNQKAFGLQYLLGISYNKFMIAFKPFLVRCPLILKIANILLALTNDFLLQNNKSSYSFKKGIMIFNTVSPVYSKRIMPDLVL